MNEYNKTETDSNRYREQTSGYQWREGYMQKRHSHSESHLEIGHAVL